MFKTHLVVGILASLLLIDYLVPVSPIIFGVSLTIGAILPDIDYPKSKPGRKFKPVSKTLHLLFGHRRFMHTVYPPIIFFVSMVAVQQSLIGFAALLGYIVHLLVDSLTKEGIALFAPFYRARLQGPITTGGIKEYIMFICLVIALGFKIFYMIY